MNGIKNNKCEWCGKTYPPVANELYYKLEVFGIEHMICGDCFDRLKEGVSVRLKLVEYVKRGHGRTNNHRGINQGRGMIKVEDQTKEWQEKYHKAHAQIKVKMMDRYYNYSRVMKRILEIKEELRQSKGGAP